MPNLRIEIRYAVLITLLMILEFSTEYMIMLHDNYIAYQPYVSLVAVITILLVCLRFAVRSKTEELNGKITFRQAFASGFLVAFFAAVLSVPEQVIFHKLINPDFFDNMIQYAENHAQFLNMDVNKAHDEAAMYFNLPASIIQTGLVTLTFGTLAALIFAWQMNTEK